MKKYSIIFGLFVLICGCVSKEKQSGGDLQTDSVAGVSKRAMDKEFYNILESIPSPLEYSAILQNSGAKYTETFLNKPENGSKYLSQFSKAINLGIYGADLAYINLYEKTYSAIDYLSVVYRLSNDLNIGEYFDFETLKRIATNNKNLDSLIYISTRSFEKMHKSLRKTNNEHVSVSIIVGGWIEALYLSTQIINSTKNTASSELILLIYDEHIVLDDLLVLLERFKDKPYFQKLIENLQNLKNTYSKIGSSDNIVKGKPMSSQQYLELSTEIKEIRNSLIK